MLLRLAPGTPEPVVLAANRDEFRARPADDPAVLADGVFAGRDRLAGGTWLALGRHGVAALTNIAGGERRPGARSRGILPLDALRGTLPGIYDDFGPFHLVVVDTDGARLLSRLPDGRVVGPLALPPGDHVIANEPFDAPPSPRVLRARALLHRVGPDFGALTDHGEPPEGGLCHHGPAYGTVSSTVLALDPAWRPVRYLHRAGLPCRADTRDLTREARAAVGLV